MKIILVLFLCFISACSYKNENALIDYDIYNTIALGITLEECVKEKNNHLIYLKYENVLEEIKLSFKNNKIPFEFLSPSKTNLFSKEIDNNGGWAYNQHDGKIYINSTNKYYIDSSKRSWIIPSEIKFIPVSFNVYGSPDMEAIGRINTIIKNMNERFSQSSK